MEKCGFCLDNQKKPLCFGKSDEEKEGAPDILFLRLFFLYLLHNVPGWAVPFPPLFSHHTAALTAIHLTAECTLPSINPSSRFWRVCFFCCPALVCAVGKHLYGGQYGKFCNTSCPCAFDFFAFADHCPAHPLVLEIKHQFRLRIFMSVAAQFRFGLYRSLFSCQRGNGHHRGISGTAGHRRSGAGAVFSLTEIF